MFFFTFCVTPYVILSSFRHTCKENSRSQWHWPSESHHLLWSLTVSYILTKKGTCLEQSSLGQPHGVLVQVKWPGEHQPDTFHHQLAGVSTWAVAPGRQPLLGCTWRNTWSSATSNFCHCSAMVASWIYGIDELIFCQGCQTGDKSCLFTRNLR